MIDQFQDFKLRNLVDSGHSKEIALNALNIWEWDLSQARNYLKSHGGAAKEDQNELQNLIALSKTEAGIGQFQHGNELNFLSDLEPWTLEERRRIGSTPVGLKNIGNTCYLSAFIQSLYHLPEVMKKMMALEDSADLQRQSSLNTMKRIEWSYKLMVELKRLFAFMTKSEKKYADPTACIRNIVDDFGNQMKIGDQQDITEVSEGFMSRIHEGFQALYDPFQSIDDIIFGEESKAENEGSEEEKEDSFFEHNNGDMLERVEKYAKNK